MSFPGSLISYINPSGTSLLTSPDHAAMHTSENTEIIAIESFLGTNGASAVFSNFASGNKAARQNFETMGSPTLNNPQINGGTLGTSIVNNSTISGGTLQSIIKNNGTLINGAYGTPTINVGSDAQGDLYYRSSGGTATRLGIGASGQFVTTNGTTPSWGAGGVSVAEQAGTANAVIRNPSVIKDGWTYAAGTAGTIFTTTVAVSFTTPFNTVPIVVVGGLGFKNGNPAPTVISDFATNDGIGVFAFAYSIGTTGFTMSLQVAGGLGTNQYQGMSWMAIGT